MNYEIKQNYKRKGGLQVDRDLLLNGMNTFEQIYKAVSRIPRGKVTTYGTIAKMLGLTNPRVVGYALHVNKDPDNIPCHRVVNKDGALAPGYAFGGLDVQKQLLEQEGVSFKGSRVSMSAHFYSFTPHPMPSSLKR